MDQLPQPSEEVQWPECCGEYMDDFAHKCVCSICGKELVYEPDNIEPVEDWTQD